MSTCSCFLKLSILIALISILITCNDIVFLFVTDAIWNIFNLYDNSHFELSHNFIWNSIIYKPTSTEDTYYNLKLLKGELPSDTAGVVFFIGSNPRFISPGIKQHWFDGDGMIHSIKLIPNNQSAHYSNSWVKTPKFNKETKYNRSIFDFGFGSFHKNGLIGLLKLLFAEYIINYSPISPVSIPNRIQFGPANTALMQFNNKIYALAENSLPFEIKYDDSTSNIISVGYTNFNNSWNYPFTAHPKIDRINNKLFTFGYGMDLENKIIIGKSSDNKKDKRLIKSNIFDTNTWSIMHDMMITENYIIMFDTNLCVGPEIFKKSDYKRFIGFDDSINGRIGIIRKDELEYANITWFNVKNYIIWHSANGYEQINEENGNKEIVIISSWGNYMDMNLFQDTYKWTISEFQQNSNRLHEYRINLDDMISIKERILLNHEMMEMPFVHPLYLGKKTKYVFFSLVKPTLTDNLHWFGIAKYDLENNIIERKIIYDDWDIDDKKDQNINVNKKYFRNWGMAQVVFIPNTKNIEDDAGYLANIIYNKNTKRSTLRIWDAKTMETEPITVIEIHKRVPTTFHGEFVAKKVFDSIQN